MKRLTNAEWKALEIEMLSKFDAFCKENGLKYYLAGGTLIGAIRHNGFIPWDDDVDLFMLRDDYEKLIGFDKIDSQNEIVSYANNHGYAHPCAYAVINNNRTLMNEARLKKQSGKGVFIDIFPLDKVPSNKLSRFLFGNTIHIRSVILKYSSHDREYSKSSWSKRLFARICSCIFNEERVLRHSVKYAKKYRHADCDDIGMCAFPHPHFLRMVYNKREFGDGKPHIFESLTLNVPNEYDKVLRSQYGDYMQLPPETQRVGNHDVEYYWKQ